MLSATHNSVLMQDDVTSQWQVGNLYNEHPIFNVFRGKVRSNTAVLLSTCQEMPWDFPSNLISVQVYIA
jgi:hypothetical protein